MSAEFTEEPTPELQPEYRDLIETDDVLELSKLSYYQACFDFADKPSRRMHKSLQKSTDALGNAFEQHLDALKQGSTSYEYMVAASNAVTIHGKNRVDALNAYMEGTELGHTKSDIPSESAWDVNEDQEADMMTIIHDSALDVFIQTLVSDTNAFIDYVEESSPGKRAHLKEQLLEHGVDVAKIAIGTAVGMVAVKFISRKK